MYHARLSQSLSLSEPKSSIMRAQYKINFDRPPRLKKLPEALIISPELRHPTDRQTERHKSKSRSTIHNSAKETGHK